MFNKISNYTFNVIVDDVSVGEDAIVRVVLPVDAVGDVVAIVDGVEYIGNVNNGSASIIVANLSAGNYNVEVTYNGDDKYVKSSLNATFKVNMNINSVNLTVNDLVKYFGGEDRLIAILLDNNKNPIANANVTFIVNGKEYIRTTGANGSASMAINLNTGKYDITTKFNGNTKYESAIVNSTITIKSTVTGQNIVKMFRNATQYYALFLDSEGNALINTTVKFNINGVMYERQTNASGIAKLNINLDAGNYVITNYNTVTGEENSNNITVKSLLTDNHELVKYYKNESQYSIKVVGKDGKIVANKEVTFNINGVFYKRSTDENGIATLKINLNPGDYIITANYDDCVVSDKITVKPTLLANDLSMTYKDGSKFNVTVLDAQGNPLANQNVRFNVNGVFYNKVSGENGVASLNINLLKGKYIITSMWNDYQVGCGITIV